MKQFLLPIFLLALFTAACGGTNKTTRPTTDRNKPTKNKQSVYFENSETLTPLLDQAAEEGKIVFLDFYTDWCLPCKLMDEDVFTDPGVADYFNDNFINYKVNAEKGNGVNLRVVFNVGVYPTLIFVDSRGRELVRREGAAYPTDLMALGNEALAKLQAN